MRFTLTLTLAAFALIVAARAQEKPPPQDEQQIIDDFVTTRGFVFVEPDAKKKPAAKPGGQKGRVAQKGSRRRPGKGSAAQAGKAGDEAAALKEPTPAPQGGGVAGGGAVADAAVLKAGGAVRPIALGYTLYRNDAGRLVVTDESAAFTRNDRLRLFLETNTDGYIYVFNTTDGASPVMLYPHASVEGGRNSVVAHTRNFIPAEGYIVFDAVPGTERVHIVISRRPLAGVPAGEELVRRYGGAAESRAWEPTASEWARIEALIRQGGRVRQGRFAQLAQLAPVSPDGLQRGLTVQPEEPPPAVVRVNDSAAPDLLVTTIDLIHK